MALIFVGLGGIHYLITDIFDNLCSTCQEQNVLRYLLVDQNHKIQELRKRTIYPSIVGSYVNN